MFICSVKASTIRRVGLLVLAFAIAAGVWGWSATRAVAASGSVRFHKIKNDSDRVAFLAQFGWEVDPTPVEEETFTLPETFDRVLMGYNEIQKTQGLDLGRYKNKKVTRYTYEVKNYPGYDGTVYANILMYRDKVIAGDICSADTMGFVEPLIRKS